jgi:hypothetical protein
MSDTELSEALTLATSRLAKTHMTSMDLIDSSTDSLHGLSMLTVAIQPLARLLNEYVQTGREIDSNKDLEYFWTGLSVFLRAIADHIDDQTISPEDTLTEWIERPKSRTQ